MNLNQLVTKVQRNLDDLSANFYKVNEDIVPSIQDGYDMVAALCETIERTVAVNFQNGKVYYDFKTQIPDYLRIFGIYNNNTNRWMEPLTQMDLFRLRDDWELTAGEPYAFMPIDWRTVALFPTQITATGNMSVMYKATAPILGMNDEPELPLSEQTVLESYATDDLLDQAQEWVKALDYAKLTESSLDQILKIVRNRSSPNHLYFKHG